jgi:hypothetical protein
MRIAISPDENPGDPGAVHSGIVERTVNIAVATALEAALKRSGQDAWFNPSITYQERVDEANRDGSQLLVACAHNAAGSPAAEGALFIVCPVDNDGGAAALAFGHQKALAEKVGELLIAGGLAGHWSFYAEEVYECCAFNGDTLYCELGYETNPTDAARIKQPDYPVRAAELIAQGIAMVMGFNYSPLHPVSAPPPEWKVNLQPLPAPLVGVLASPVDVINTITSEKVGELAQGTSLTVSHQTRVRDREFYMTQFAVEHETGYALPKEAVTFEGLGDNPEPAPASAPPPSPPAAQPTPKPSGLAGLEEDARDWLIGFADRELIQLIEFAIAEWKKRVEGKPA